MFEIKGSKWWRWILDAFFNPSNLKREFNINSANYFDKFDHQSQF